MRSHLSLVEFNDKPDWLLISAANVPKPPDNWVVVWTIKKWNSHMKSIFDAANALTQEIERTRQHLDQLENALAGLKPLMGIDASATMLSFGGSQSVDDASPLVARVINAETIKVKTSVKKARSQKEKETIEPAKVPPTGADLWLSCIGRKKFSVLELVDLAIKKLELDDTARVVVTNRAGAWLHAAVKKGILTNAGTRDGSRLYLRVPKPVKEKKAAVDSSPAQSTEAPTVLVE